MGLDEIKLGIKSICQDFPLLEGIDSKKAEPKILEFLERYKSNYHHIEYDIDLSFVKVRLFTSEDDGMELLIKIGRAHQAKN
jgi:hypothetical protein